MPTPHDWAFDVQAFFRTNLGDPLGFDPDDLQRYPDRIVGTLYSGTTHNPVEQRTTILLRGTGPDNAETFKRWVTVLPAQWQTMGNKPKPWRYLILQIGLYPDGTPYWANLYDEAALAPVKEHAERMGGFVRFDPGLTQPALVATWDAENGTFVVREDAPTAEEAGAPLAVPTGRVPVDPGDPGGRQPAQREAVKGIIDAGVSLMFDQSQIVLLDKAYLDGLRDRLEMAARNVQRWRIVRSKQSYSKQKHDERSRGVPESQANRSEGDPSQLRLPG
jgi:hypothetical protein